MKEADRDSISIITINFNRVEITLELLLSIEEHCGSKHEVIVVDNASDKDPTVLIKQQFPEVKVIRSPKNLGFSGGNNLGAKHANGDYFFFVNNDTLFSNKLVDNLIKPFSRIDHLGIVSPKIVYHDSPNIIQYAGSTEINSLTGRNKMIGQGQNDTEQDFQSGFTWFAHGSAMMIKAKLFKDIGGFTEIFFLYYEEVDLSFRIRRLGYSIYYCGEAVVYHRVSSTTGIDNPLKTYYMTRNRILFMRRNHKRLNFIIFLLYFGFFAVPKNSIQYLFSQEFDKLNAFYRGIRWNISMIGNGIA